ELRERGVSGELADRVIEGVLEDAGTSDAELALRVAEDWVRRQAAALLEALAAGRRDPGHERARRRLVGYLVRRGFRGEGLRAGEERAAARAAEAAHRLGHAAAGLGSGSRA